VGLRRRHRIPDQGTDLKKLSSNQKLERRFNSTFTTSPAAMYLVDLWNRVVKCHFDWFLPIPPRSI
jgi:hypothetical protein